MRTQVNVMGCSAGSLGALFNAPFVFKRFPNATHRVWGESEVGVVSGAQWYVFRAGQRSAECVWFIESHPVLLFCRRCMSAWDECNSKCCVFAESS
jgi:hypothetical protein